MLAKILFLLPLCLTGKAAPPLSTPKLNCSHCSIPTSIPHRLTNAVITTKKTSGSNLSFVDPSKLLKPLESKSEEKHTLKRYESNLSYDDQKTFYKKAKKAALNANAASKNGRGPNLSPDEQSKLLKSLKSKNNEKKAHERYERNLSYDDQRKFYKKAEETAPNAYSASKNGCGPNLSYDEQSKLLKTLESKTKGEHTLKKYESILSYDDQRKLNEKARGVTSTGYAVRYLYDTESKGEVKEVYYKGILISKTFQNQKAKFRAKELEKSSEIDIFEADDD